MMDVINIKVYFELALPAFGLFYAMLVLADLPDKHKTGFIC